MCNVSVDGQDEGAGACCHGVEVVHEGTDLAPSMSVVDVAVGLGFRDDELEAGGGASGDDVGTVAADALGAPGRRERRGGPL